MAFLQSWDPSPVCLLLYTFRCPPVFVSGVMPEILVVLREGTRNKYSDSIFSEVEVSLGICFFFVVGSDLGLL